MIPSEITVEVRDKNLVRVGQIRPEDLNLTANVRHLGIGSWKIKIPSEHEMAGPLQTPGSGIIVSVRGREFMSGFMRKPSRSASPEDQDGILTVTGVDDKALAEMATALPSPSIADPSAQTKSHDVRSGPAETVMRQYLDANIGPSAPMSRRGALARRLVLAPDLARGPLVSKSARLPRLSELLSEIALLGNLGWTIIQRGNQLVFEIYQVQDRTKFVRFDIKNGTLTQETVEMSAPSITRAIVLGQGEGVDRQILQRTTPASLAAEEEWGVIHEVSIDQRQTSIVKELEQAGDKRLLEGGFTAVNVKAVPTDDTTMQYKTDWAEGDAVTVVVRGQETVSTVTEVAMVVNQDGVTIGAAIGDVSGFNAGSSLTSRVEDTERKISSLERNAEDTSGAGVRRVSGEIVQYAGATAPTGWLMCSGQLVSRTTYSELFATLGTRYGAGDGSTTFALPDLRGRVAVGPTASAPYNVLGNKGGSDVHTLTQNEMPSHTHTQTAHNHTQNSHFHSNGPAGTFHTFRWGNGNGVNVHVAGAQATGGPPPSNELATVQGDRRETLPETATNNATTAVNQATGGGAAHNNMQPYIILNHIIKT